MWIQNPDTTLRTWNDAVDYCNALTTAAGYSDWRLPNLRELQSLIDYGVTTSVKLPSGHPFSGVQPYYSWSSTTYADDTTLAWGMHLLDGRRVRRR